MYQVQKNIPIQSTYGQMTGFFRNLAIGDSFECPDNERAKIYQIALQAGIKVKSAKDKTTGLVRVWRIE